MNLRDVKIVNFRSVENLEISLVPFCRVLVGINESGKSNILAALRLLDGDATYSRRDIRKVRSANHDPIESSYVTFRFLLDPACFDLLARRVSKTSEGLSKSQRAECVKAARSVKETKYSIDIMEEERKWIFSNPDVDDSKCDGLAVLSPSANREHPLADGRKIGSIELFGVKVEGTPDDWYQRASAEDVTKFLRRRLLECMKLLRPHIVEWSYADEYLLPSEVPLQEFKDDPEICEPLRHMFFVSGYDSDNDIVQALDDAEGVDHGLVNLLEDVADKSTKVLARRWKDCAKLQIVLNKDGGAIQCGIRDVERNIYSFGQRSDGFKRFITFQLMLAYQVDTKVLDRSLILIDEPENGLHPGGAEALLKELLRLSSSDVRIVYSTHSIFMVDKDRIDRHIIVDKKSEVTVAATAGVSKLNDYEVVYKALEFSTYGIMNKANLLFEGWRDKKLFQTAFPRNRSRPKALREYGLMHATGAKNIGTVAVFLESVEREYAVVADSDRVSSEAKKRFSKAGREGRWCDYASTMENDVQTGEDFIKVQVLISATDMVASRAGIPKVPTGFELPEFGRLERIVDYFRDNVDDSDDARTLANEVKEAVFDKLKKDHIEPAYFDFADRMAAALTK